MLLLLKGDLCYGFRADGMGMALGIYMGRAPRSSLVARRPAYSVYFIGIMRYEEVYFVCHVDEAARVRYDD